MEGNGIQTLNTKHILKNKWYHQKKMMTKKNVLLQVRVYYLSDVFVSPTAPSLLLLTLSQ